MSVNVDVNLSVKVEEINLYRGEGVNVKVFGKCNCDSIRYLNTIFIKSGSKKNEIKLIVNNSAGLIIEDIYGNSIYESINGNSIQEDKDNGEIS